MTFRHQPRAARVSRVNHIRFGQLLAIANEAAGVQHQPITRQSQYPLDHTLTQLSGLHYCDVAMANSMSMQDRPGEQKLPGTQRRPHGVRVHPDYESDIAPEQKGCDAPGAEHDEPLPVHPDDSVMVMVFFPFRKFVERHIGSDVRAPRDQIVHIELLQALALSKRRCNSECLSAGISAINGFRLPVSIASSAATTSGSSTVPVGLIPS